MRYFAATRIPSDTATQSYYSPENATLDLLSIISFSRLSVTVTVAVAAAVIAAVMILGPL